MLARSIDDLTSLEKMSLIDISFSRLSTYDMCPAKYFYSYVIKEPRVFGEAATLGNIIHSVLEETDFSAPLSLFDLHEAYRQKRPEWDPDYQISTQLIDDGYQILSEFVDRHQKDKFDVVAKELPFSFVLGTAYINGYIDRIDRHNGKIVVKDYKAQPLDTPILTPIGWRKMGEIQIGDMVIGCDGRPTRIIGVYPQGFLPAYRVNFTDGSSTVCSDEHLWQVRLYNNKEKVIALKELTKLREGNNYRYSIPTVAPVEFEPTEELVIHPYIMGIILGDGGLTGSALKIHSEDQEIRDRIISLLPNDLRFIKDYKESWVIRTELKRTGTNYYLQELKKLGLWGLGSPFKFIPDKYLRASIADRIELLKGLMDADGCCSTRTDYRTTSIQLRDGIVELVRSLGGNPTISSHPSYYKDKDGNKIECRLVYIINIRTHFNPFFLSRKANHWHKPIKSNLRRIKSIERILDCEMQCIRVDNPDGLYITEDYIVTHNSGKREIAAKDAPTDLQLGMYALAVSLLFPDAEVIRAELYYLRTGRIKGHDFTRQDLDNIATRLSDKVNELLEVNDFRYTEQTRVCSFCDFKSICPVGKRRFPS